MNRIVSAMTSFTRPFSYLGLPVATLPVAVSPEGLPVAIQIIGRPWREAQIASVARVLERELSSNLHAAKRAAGAVGISAP